MSLSKLNLVLALVQALSSISHMCGGGRVSGLWVPDWMPTCAGTGVGAWQVAGGYQAECLQVQDRGVCMAGWEWVPGWMSAGAGQGQVHGRWRVGTRLNAYRCGTGASTGQVDSGYQAECMQVQGRCRVCAGWMLKILVGVGLKAVSSDRC